MLDSSGVLRAVYLPEHVMDFGIVSQRLIPVGEALRDVIHEHILSGELESEPFLVSWGIRSEVNNDVVNGTLHAADEFRLYIWLNLKVHSADGAAFVVERTAGLFDYRVQPVRLKIGNCEGRCKIASVVGNLFDLDCKCVFQARFFEYHMLFDREKTLT